MNTSNTSGRDHEDQHSPAGVPPSLLSNVLDWMRLEQQADTSRENLLADLTHPEWSARTAAVQELGRAGDPALRTVLERAAKDEHVSVRAAAVYALAHLKDNAPLLLLIQALHDPEWQVREKAILALAAQGEQDSLKHIQAALFDPDSTVREAAAYALQQSNELSSAVAAQPGSEKNVQRSITVKETDTSSNGHKAGSFYLRPVWNGSQRMQGGRMMQKNPIQAELPSVPRAAEKGKRPRRGVLATLFIVAATLVIGFAWLALPQQRHPADTVTGKKIIATATPAVQPSPTVLSTGIYNYSSTYQIIVSVAWSPDSKRIALVDDTVKTWDFSTGGKGVVTYPGQTPGDNVAVAWSPDGRYLVGSGTKAQLWDADSGEAIGSYTPQVQAGQTASPENGHVIDSAWSPDGRLVASAADGQAYGFTVQVWNPQTLQTVFTIPTSPASYIRHVRWSPDGKYLAFDTNGNVLVYSVETRKLVSQNVGTIFAWSPDGKRIISVDDMAGNMLTWDSTTGQIVNTIHYQDPSPSHGIRGADSLAWSPDGTQVALATGSLSIWDVRAGKEVAVYTDPKFNGGNGITSLAWSPDGQKLASASGGEMGPGEVKVWQLK